LLWWVLVGKNGARNEETPSEMKFAFISHMIKCQDEEDAGERC